MFSARSICVRHNSRILLFKNMFIAIIMRVFSVSSGCYPTVLKQSDNTLFISFTVYLMSALFEYPLNR